MNKVNLKAYEAKFKELTSSWIEGVNWSTIELTEATIGQIGDEFQSEAFEGLGGESSEITEWEHYDDSCEVRVDFWHLLSELWDEEMERRDGLE